MRADDRLYGMDALVKGRFVNGMPIHVVRGVCPIQQLRLERDHGSGLWTMQGIDQTDMKPVGPCTH
ncbi:hypothetical protein BLA13014_06140 [Burkholderia aenigmatica]|uniref:Uncharacterized protein n=1 Tax=Burkholderia aenigmatica TaxID=2015348 RepID=A0A6P2R7E4_9BURK|nr:MULTISPECIES: hypothetical protein [Burkholderia]VWC28801.1 hypothetical protein BLA13014_06140 [Burkholderia aenigmatica]